MLLMIDNYDSFTYNLVQYLGELGADVRVYRNDAITLDEIAALRPEQIVISPGPCTPAEAGVSVELIRRFAGAHSRSSASASAINASAPPSAGDIVRARPPDARQDVADPSRRPHHLPRA